VKRLLDDEEWREIERLEDAVYADTSLTTIERESQLADLRYRRDVCRERFRQENTPTQPSD